MLSLALPLKKNVLTVALKPSGFVHTLILTVSMKLLTQKAPNDFIKQ